MPVPTSYTEAEFADYLQRKLGSLATALNWTSSKQSFDEIIIDTLNALGVSNIEDVQEAEIPKLRALGVVFLWRAVKGEVSGDYDFSADGASYSRSQVFGHAERMLTQAESDAAQYLDLLTVKSARVTYHRDPYADHDDHLSVQIDQYNDQLRAT